MKLVTVTVALRDTATVEELRDTITRHLGMGEVIVRKVVTLRPVPAHGLRTLLRLKADAFLARGKTAYRRATKSLHDYMRAHCSFP